MKYGLAFLLFSIATGYLAVSWGGVGYALLWLSVSFAVVALAYFGLGPSVFGKRADGRLSILSVILLLPYFCLVGLVWRLLRLIRRDRPLDQLTERVWIGRRLLPNELPANIELVIDLTCEVPEPWRIRSGREYICLPTLDGGAPELSKLLKLVSQLAGSQKAAYIHCAEGHGRTGLVAAALLIKTGKAADPSDAVAQVQAVRPGVRLSAAQLRMLDKFREAI